MKTMGVTTKNGVKIEVTGMGAGFQACSEALTGDNPWKELIVAFTAPPQSRGGVVRLRRESTEKFDRFIAGTVWIDDVELIGQ